MYIYVVTHIHVCCALSETLMAIEITLHDTCGGRAQQIVKIIDSVNNLDIAIWILIHEDKKTVQLNFQFFFVQAISNVIPTK